MENHGSTTPVVSSDDSEKLMEQPAAVAESPEKNAVEIGGPKGPEPTRYGDWEKAGRCTDF